jgi:hypothetical protein
LDSNPATWHLGVVNQIGVSRRGMIMDLDPTYEVWNQPVLAYHYTYFNPITGVMTPSIASARAKLADFSNDPFQGYRAEGATQVIGIEMNVTYVSEDYASVSPTNTPAQDRLEAATFRYDLELDPSGRIIGGEWYDKSHPDFLWTPPAGERSVSEIDSLVEGPDQWSGWAPLPASWAEAARQGSARLEPLSRIVEALFQLASEPAQLPATWIGGVESCRSEK